MGGELSIEDTPGGGTTMVVTLRQHGEVDETAPEEVMTP
jgi:hypothetical protein